MDALHHAVSKHAGQIPPEDFSQKGDEGGNQFAGGQQAFVQRPVGVQLVRRFPLVAPEPLAAAPDIPIAQCIDELGQCGAGGEIVVGVQAVDHLAASAGQFAKGPLIQLASLVRQPVSAGTLQRLAGQLARVAIQPLGGIEPVDVGVDHQEAVHIPQAQEELGNAVLDRAFAVANGRPRRLIGEQVPAECVGSVAIEDLLGLAVVPLLLGHLQTVFAKHQPQNNAIAEGVRVGAGRLIRIRLLLPVHQQRADGQQAVEPTSRLVQSLADEIRRKLRGELRAALPRVAPLCKRHGAGVVPAVDDLGHPLHARPASERGIVGDRVDVRLVDSQVIHQIRFRFLGRLPHLGAHHARLGQQFVVTGDSFHLSRLLADPNRQRRAPVALRDRAQSTLVSRKLPKRPSRM